MFWGRIDDCIGYRTHYGFYNKKEMNFEDDNIKIVSIKKSSKVSQFINYIVSKLNLKKNKQLEAPIIDTELVEEKGKSKWKNI